MRLMYVLCRLPQSLCDKIDLEKSEMSMTEEEKQKEKEQPGSVIIERLLEKVSQQDHRLQEGVKLENLVPVDAVAADGYRRYNKLALELAKKHPYRGPHAQPRGRGEEEGSGERAPGLMAALRPPYRPHVEEQRARRPFEEWEWPPRREDPWDQRDPFQRRDRFERGDPPRRVAFADRSRSRERERGRDRPAGRERLTRRQRAVLVRGRSRDDVRPCVTCNRTGHFDTECPTWLALPRIFPSIERMCRKCFGLGHRSQACKAERGLLWSGG